MEPLFRNNHLRTYVVTFSFILAVIFIPIIWYTDALRLKSVAKMTLTISILALLSGSFYEKIRFTEKRTKANLSIKKYKFPIENDDIKELWEGIKNSYENENIHFLYEPKKSIEYQIPEIQSNYWEFLSEWNKLIDPKKTGEFIKWTFASQEKHSLIYIKFSKIDPIILQPESKIVIYSKLKERNLSICKMYKGAKGEKIYGKH